MKTPRTNRSELQDFLPRSGKINWQTRRQSLGLKQNFGFDKNGSKKVQVGKGQEKAQSEKDSHSKNRDAGKKLN